MNPTSPTTLVLPNSSASIPHILSLLETGKLVILPTETIYGIAVNLRLPEARARVKQLKNMTGHPGWVLHVGSADETLSRYLTSATPLASRLLRRSWPGPIAYQFPLSPPDLHTLTVDLADAAPELLAFDPDAPSPNLATFRCPDVSITRDILSACFARNIPIAMIGATLPGGPPATDPSSIPPAIADHVEAIIDAGPTRYSKPSTLVRIDQERLRVLRPGVIDERIIQRLADYVILFVCSGNTCRSPMAAALAKKILAERLAVKPEHLSDKHVVVQSAGLHATRGMRATREGIEAVRELGADLSSHLSQPATIDVLRRADAIYTMTQDHRSQILDVLPGSEKKTFLLDPDGDVEDPIGGDESVYRQVAQRFQELLSRHLSEIAL